MQNYILTGSPEDDIIGGPQASASLTPRPELQLYHMMQNLSIEKLHKFLPQNFLKFSNRHIAQKICCIFVQYYHLHFCFAHGILNVSNEREVNEIRTNYEILVGLLKSQKFVYDVTQIEGIAMICLTFRGGKVIFNHFKIIEKIIENA